MYSLVTTSIIQGIKSIPVYVEADVSDGMPLFEMVGSLSPEVKESKERVRTALKNTGYILPPKRITINFIPANIRKTGSGFDLPVVAAVLCAIGIVPEEALKDTMVVGEISLSGDVKPVNGILPMVAEAKERGVTRCIVPAENQTEALLVKEIEIFAVQSIAEMIHILNGGTYIEKEIGKVVAKTAQMLDFSDIQGQYFVKRACEVAVSGMHNLLMIGPPGAGKTMTAMRIPTILPPLDEKEQMELSKIYSVSGQFQLREQLMEKRPFFIIITGANMAGKSTYLRTVGVNYLLACIGAPVWAAKMEIFPARLVTSLRTSDSLTDNESYFFAELKRLKLIIDKLKAGEELFIILDEILKGTNSMDKQKGSFALIKQFMSMDANGIIATHDLLLGTLIDAFPQNIRNYCFEADITNNELTFSYQMRSGVAQNMNACFLMKKMGIAVIDD